MARILREDAERLLGDVPDEYLFQCCDGRTLRNMRDLEKALISMADETYAFHSNTEKADFSVWVSDVIGDEKLARDLAKSPNQAQAARNVTSRAVFLESRLA